MKILGIETSTGAGGAALTIDGRLIGEEFERTDTNHSRRLLPAIDRLLKQAAIQPRDVGLIAVSLGPGSFTGLRIGMAVAKGLAVSTGAPIIGVSTMDAFAFLIAKAGLGAPIRPVIDARKDEVYTALFDPTGKRLTPDENIGAESLAEKIKNERITLAGNGARRYETSFSKALGANWVRPPSEMEDPRPSAVAELGAMMFNDGTRHNADTLAPVYVRGPTIS